MAFSGREEKAGKAADVSAETGSIAEQTVKPGHMTPENLYHPSDIKHSEQRSGTDYAPLPPAPEAITARHGKRHQRTVYYDLCLCERHAGHTADRNLYPLARHSHRTATHLHRDAESHDRTTNSLRRDLHRKRRVVENRSQRHVEVYERTEKKTDQQLEQLDRLEPASQYGYLREHKDHVHDIGVFPYRQSRNQPVSPGHRKSHRQRRDDTAAEATAHAQCHPESHDIKRNDK